MNTRLDIVVVFYTKFKHNNGQKLKYRIQFFLIVIFMDSYYPLEVNKFGEFSIDMELASKCELINTLPATASYIILCYNSTFKNQNSIAYLVNIGALSFGIRFDVVSEINSKELYDFQEMMTFPSKSLLKEIVIGQSN
jgi:hypothetical protein